MNENRAKRVIIHLGPPKTGTTSIQDVFFRARDELANLGIRYANAGLIPKGQTFTVQRSGRIKRISGPGSAHHLLPRTLLGEVEELEANDVWDALGAEIAACPQHTVVVSSEAFSRLGRGHVETVRSYLQPHTVTPVAYVREPLARMLSDYTQRVKSGHCHSTFGEFLREERRMLQDYDGYIAVWDAVFGPDSVALRSFDAAVAADGLEQDFVSLVPTANETLGKYRPSDRLNTSPGASTIRAQRGINSLEILLGRPAVLRRAFDAVRRVASMKFSIALSRALDANTAIATEDDAEFIRALTANRYAGLLARCRRIGAAQAGDAGQLPCPTS